MRTITRELKPTDFGSFRTVDLLHEKCSAQHGELFFSIEPRNKDGKYSSKKVYGYIKLTNSLSEYLSHELFTGCGGIQFIQWEDCWNVVFDEKSIIGNISFHIPFDDFHKIFGNILEGVV
jgi:hypothetical protein